MAGWINFWFWLLRNNHALAMLFGSFICTISFQENVRKDFWYWYYHESTRFSLICQKSETSVPKNLDQVREPRAFLVELR